MAVFFQFFDIQLDHAVPAACGREYRIKSLKGDIQIDLYARMDGKWADAPYGMSDHAFYIFYLQHLRLASELGAVLFIVDLPIPGGHHQDRGIAQIEGCLLYTSHKTAL